MRVFLHLGEPKTGSSYLQGILWEARWQLLERGFSYPGDWPKSQWRGAEDVLEMTQEPGDPEDPFDGAWDELVAQGMRDADTVIISHELLSYATRQQAERALATLQGAEVHLVLTVRDVAGLIPAEWQELVKHRNPLTWEEWLDDTAVSEQQVPDRNRERHFWRSHDSLSILDTWGRDLPPEQVHVITIPRANAGRDALWLRFAGVVGLDPTGIDTDTEVTNVSLGIAEAETIRRLNEVLPPEFPNWSYQWFVKHAIAQETFPKRPMSPRLQLPARLSDFAAAESDRLIDGLKATGYDIVGDLEELRPRRVQAPDRSPADVGSDELLDAALFAITGLLDRLEEDRLERESAPVHGPAVGALLLFSERYETLHRLRRAYWRAMDRRRRRRGELPSDGDRDAAPDRAGGRRPAR